MRQTGICDIQLGKHIDSFPTYSLFDVEYETSSGDMGVRPVIPMIYKTYTKYRSSSDNVSIRKIEYVTTYFKDINNYYHRMGDIDLLLGSPSNSSGCVLEITYKKMDK